MKLDVESILAWNIFTIGALKNISDCIIELYGKLCTHILFRDSLWSLDVISCLKFDWMLLDAYKKSWIIYNFLEISCQKKENLFSQIKKNAFKCMFAFDVIYKENTRIKRCYGVI